MVLRFINDGCADESADEHAVDDSARALAELVYQKSAFFGDCGLCAYCCLRSSSSCSSCERVFAHAACTKSYTCQVPPLACATTC